MRLIKKKLLKIPVEPAPEFSEGKSNVIRARVVDFCGGKLLVVTFYRRAGGVAVWRVHIDQDGNTANLACQAGTWSKETVEQLKDGQEFYSWNEDRIGYAGPEDEAAGRVFFGYEKKSTFQAVSKKQEEKEVTARKAAAEAESNLIQRILEEQPEIPDDAVQWALDNPLKRFRYLFYHSEKRRDPLTGMKERFYVGYCTHCHRNIELLCEPGHKQETLCPVCNSPVTTMAERYGHSKLIHCEQMRIFLKTPGGAVFVRMIDLCLDFSEAFRGARLSYADAGFYYFNTGEAYEFKPQWHYREPISWNKLSGVYESTGYEKTYPIPEGYFDDTCLRHSHLKEYMASYNYPAPMRYLAAYVKTPAVEHLLGCGLHMLLRDKVLQAGFTGKILDLTKNRPRDMLGVSQPEVEQFAREGWNSAEIYGYKICKVAGFIPTDEDIRLIAEFAERNSVLYRKMFRADTARYVLSFLRRQRKREKTLFYVFNDWKDYQAECVELGYRLDDPKILYPPDLRKAHGKTTKLLQQKRKEEAHLKSETERIIYRKQLEARQYLDYTDETAGLLIQVAQSRQELVDEGAALGHCVGGYAESHLSGNTTILFIRRIAEPDKSYFTLEFKNGKINQNRGKSNCAPPDEVKQFAEKWLREVASKKPKKEKIEIRVQVAVA